MHWGIGVVVALLATTAVHADDIQYLSESDMIALADNMAGHGRLDDAGQIYSLMQGSTDASIRTESLFQLGNIAMARGDYAAAISAYRGIVDSNPNLPRVRLELARAYFMNGEYQAAQFHFEFVRATPNLPDTVREKIDQYLTLIRMRKNRSLDFGLGIVPDSNINNAGTESEECINTIFGPLCRPLEVKESGVGLRLNADLNHYMRFTQRFGLRTTFGIDALDFPTSRFDDYGFYFASGPRYVFDRGDISLQPTVSARLYGGDFYSYAYGGRVDTSWQIGRRLLLSGGGTATINRYHTDYINDALRGYDWGLSISPRYYLNNKSFVLAGLRFDQNNTKIKSYGSDNITYSVGYFGEFKWGFSLYSRADLITAKYHAPSWFVVDNKFVEKHRRDNIWRGYVRLSNNKISWYNIVPAVSYTYTRHESNIPSREYDKHRVEIELMRRF